jgi:hypothetical protein
MDPGEGVAAVPAVQRTGTAELPCVFMEAVYEPEGFEEGWDGDLLFEEVEAL